MRAALIFAALAACIRYEPVDCPDGRVCAPGRLCVVVAASGPEPTQQHCIEPDQVCDPSVPACELGDGTSGECHDGACLPIGCGNARVDVGEACDDGDQLPGDGCSGDCLSAEVCGNGTIDAIAGEQCDDANALSHDGCSSRCTLESPVWTPLKSGVPSRRVLHAMAYDAARGEVVMFGGTFDPAASPAEQQDTWTWNGYAWLQQTTVSHPGPRRGHAMAYDAARERVVLFGGVVNFATRFDDTWLWDGASWQLVQATFYPPKREGASLTYDARRKRTVLFGGRGSVALADIWEWDGVEWTKATPTSGPTPRWDHAAAYDPKRGVIVMQGGSCMTPPCDAQVWEYDGVAWTSDSVTGGPGQRHMHDAVYDPINETVLFVGGYAIGSSVPSSEVWGWDGQQWTRPSTLPMVIGAHAVARDTLGHVVAFAGYGQGVPPSDLTTVWDGASWTTHDVRPIEPFYRAGAVVDLARGRIVHAGTFGPPATTWELFDGRWMPHGAVAPTRDGYAIAYDARRRETILFGGIVGAGLVDETWRFDGVAWNQLSPARRPPPSDGIPMVYDAARDRIVLVGASTWLWDGTTWTDAGASGLPPTTRHSLAYDPVRERVVLFGGQAASVVQSLTYEWDGTTWVDHPVAGPPARVNATMAWNPARRRIVLMGGASLATSEIIDAWEWDGVSWSPIVVSSGPLGREFGIAAPAPDGTGVIVFGGTLNGGSFVVQHDDTWLLSWRDAVAYERCGRADDDDGDGLAACDDPDCWFACTPMCLPSAVCNPSAPRCGDAVANPALETCASCPIDVGACAAACGDFTCTQGEAATTCPGDC